MKKEEFPKIDPYIALKYPDFRFFVTVKILMTLALQIQAVIVGWHVYYLTHDPLSLGLIGLVEIIPNFSVTLFAGHFADLYDRKKIVYLCMAVLLFCSLALYYTSYHVATLEPALASLCHYCFKWICQRSDSSFAFFNSD